MAKQNEIAEILRATAMGKKFKPSKFPTFSEVFPSIEAAETLGMGSISRKKRKQTGMAAKAVAALGGDAPAWVLDNLA